MSTVGGLRRGVTLEQAATYGAAGNAAATAGGATAAAGAAPYGGGEVISAGITAIGGPLKAARTAMQIAKEINKIMHSELAKEPTLIPPETTRPGMKRMLDESKELRDAVRRDAAKNSCKKP